MHLSSSFLYLLHLAFADLMFLETSALTGDNVEEVFLKCARSIFSKVEAKAVDPSDSHSGIVEHTERKRLDAPPSNDGCSC